MKIPFLILLILTFLSCKNVSEKENQNMQIVVDSTGLKIEKAERSTKNLNLISFLENPIDWQNFKKKRGGNVTTSVTNGLKFHFNPKFKDSIYYSYNLITESIGEKGINEAIVFKYGNNKHKYDDETEVLVELKISNKDLDLGKADLVGLTKTEMETQFGTDHLTLDNGIVYSNKNKIMILELENSKVKSYRFIKLNTEKIEIELIGEIIK